VFDCAVPKDVEELKTCVKAVMRASKNIRIWKEVHHVAVFEELGSPSDFGSESDDPGGPAPPTAGAKRKAEKQHNGGPPCRTKEMNVLRGAPSGLNVGLISKDTKPSAKEKEAATSCCPKNVSGGKNMCDSKNHGLGVYKGSQLLAILMS
jgi:hypothetical protein